MVLKTRDRLIEVARLLFLMKGIENTTMIDIANASENGRRTVYTYFKSKSDIFNAVIERESENHVAELRKIATMTLPATEKLTRYLECHFENIRNESFHYDNITAWMSLDFSRSEKIRQAVLTKEIELIRAILREGIIAGEFDSEACDLLIPVLPTFIQAMSRQALEEDKHRNNAMHFNVKSIIAYIINSVKLKKQYNTNFITSK